MIGEINLYQNTDGSVPASRKWCAIITLEAHVAGFHYASTAEAAKAKADTFWEAQKAKYLPKIDKRNTKDPMARLAKALDTLAAQHGVDFDE